MQNLHLDLSKFVHFQKKGIRFEEQISQNTILKNDILISVKDHMCLVNFFDRILKYCLSSEKSVEKINTNVAGFRSGKLRTGVQAKPTVEHPTLPANPDRFRILAMVVELMKVSAHGVSVSITLW